MNMKIFAKQLTSWVLVMILLFSTLASAQWNQTSGANGSFMYCFTVKGNDVFAGYGSGVNSGGIIRSTDYGVNWSDVNTGLPSRQIMALTTSGNNLFTSQYDGGIYISTDDGANWSITALTVEYINGFAIIGNNLFAASKYNGVHLTTDNGTSWNLVNSGITDLESRAIYSKGSNLFVGTRGGGVFLSTNNGSSWTAVNTGLTMKYVYSFTPIGSTAFIISLCLLCYIFLFFTDIYSYFNFFPFLAVWFISRMFLSAK